MSNPILMLVHNALSLTKRAVLTVRSQTLPTDLWMLDNDSTDATSTWVRTENFPFHSITYVSFHPQLGVSRGWNWGLRMLFARPQTKHVLVVNNDVELPPGFYADLLEYDLPFVTGASTEDRSLLRSTNVLASLPPPHPHPDFSAFLIRRDAWEAVGPFDERMVMYAQDCAWHVEANRKGIRLMNSGVPFYHERSSTLRLSEPEERTAIERQANADRAVFRELYGCNPWEPAYERLFL